MANVLTGLAPHLLIAADTVCREQVGFVASVSRDANATRAAKGQPVRSPVVPAMTSSAISPAATPPGGTAQTVTYIEHQITDAEAAIFPWQGEETLSLQNAGIYARIIQDQFAQAMRAVVNKVELAIANAAVAAASRAYGTAGTPPFGTLNVLSDVAQPRKILEDNGAPSFSDLHMILNSSASANIRGVQATLFRVNESGSDALLRRGEIGQLEGFAMHQSSQLPTRTKGTGTLYVVNNSGGYAVGATSIIVGTGTGTVLAGDSVTFAGDTNRYVVKTGITAAGTLVIQNPGLRKTLADTTAMTVGADFTPNIAMHRSAIVAAIRPPALPEGGDLGEHRLVTDAYSGITFDVALYKGYQQNMMHVSLAWGVTAFKGEFIVDLLG